MGNIPLQNGGQFISPIQKRGVNPNWNTQQYEYAKSIIAGFNAMGQQIGNDMTRLGKAMMRQEEEESDKAEREATMNDAHSISLLKIRTDEDFAAVEKTITAKEYKTVEEFDADWNTAILPQMDEAHEVLMQDADIVWNRQRIQPQAQRAYEISREQFRVKARAGVEARVTQRRQENAAKALSAAGAKANIPAIMAGKDAAIAAGIVPEQVDAMTRGALFEAFAVTQRQAMEQYGGVNSTLYKIAMHNALSAERDNISEKIRAILNADDEKIFDAWKAGDFSTIIGDAKTAASKNTGTGGKQSGRDIADGPEVIGEDWEQVRKAGIQAANQTHDEAIEAIEKAKQQGIITAAQAASIKEGAESEKQNALRKIDSDILVKREAAAKEQRELAKALIETAARSEGEFLEHATNVQYSGKTAVNLNEKIQWMRERPNGEYDDARSRSALLRIYANAGRFTDAADADGSYRLSALALARKNCNAADYAKAISFLAGGDKDSVMQKQIENGMFKVFEAAGLDGDKIGKAHIGDNEEAELAALCGDVVQLAGNLPPAAFRHEIEGMCERLKKSQSERERIRYMEDYLSAATRDIENIAVQMNAEKTQSEDTTTKEAKALVDKAKKNSEQKAEARQHRDVEESKAKELLKKGHYQTTIPTPGMTGNLMDIWNWIRN